MVYKRKPPKLLLCFVIILLWGGRTFWLFRDAEQQFTGPNSAVETLELGANDEPDTKGDWRTAIHVKNNGDTVLPPRYILGIMTHDVVKREEERRELMRSTYLSYFRDHGTPEEKHRICALHEIVDGTVSFDDCQVAYTFVMGLSSDLPPDNRTELLTAPTSQEMIRSHSEPDVILLDIKENGKFGKSPTWFRYATLLMKEHNLPVDYIIKTDSDTLIIPTRFLRWVDEKEAKVDYQRSHIYGGMPIDKQGCGWPSHQDCQYLVAPYFHGGGLYFASTDVARYIVSDQCPRSRLFLPHEDVTMGNYVHSMTNLTGRPIVSFANPEAYLSTWKHPVKEPKRIKGLWRTYISKQKKRRQNVQSDTGAA